MPHDKFSPSRLAQLEQCLDWQSGGDSDAANYGTAMHALIANVAQGNAVEADINDVNMAFRAVRWMQSLGDLRWNHEKFIPGVVPETGGTIDAWSHDMVNKCLIVIDWKGANPLPTSMQGRTYALNLWQLFTEAGKDIQFVRVHYFNYMTGEFVSAEFHNKDQLRSDIAALIRRHGGQMGNRRAANPGCAYCKHNATCETAMTETTTALEAVPETELMPLKDLLAFYTKLEAVMKRAEALAAAAKERLMTAARAGNLPGYTVKSKRGNKLDWADEVAAKGVIDQIVHENFMQVNEYNLFGLRQPSKVKEELKASIGASHGKAVDDMLAPYITQNTYDTLVRSKP